MMRLWERKYNSCIKKAFGLPIYCFQIHFKQNTLIHFTTFRWSTKILCQGFLGHKEGSQVCDNCNLLRCGEVQRMSWGQKIDAFELAHTRHALTFMRACEAIFKFSSQMTLFQHNTFSIIGSFITRRNILLYEGLYFIHFLLCTLNKVKTNPPWKNYLFSKIAFISINFRICINAEYKRVRLKKKTYHYIHRILINQTPLLPMKNNNTFIPIQL